MSSPHTTLPTLALHDGRQIPQLGFGVWQIEPELTATTVAAAIEAGYRSIDTASVYENEVGVGKGIRDSGVDRAELFVTTKLWNSEQSHDDAMRALQTSLELLGLEYVDLYLIHWPSPWRTLYAEAWRALVRLRDAGLTRSIGVSNFEPEHLERVAAATGEMPTVNQVELHPYFQQSALRSFHERHDIVTEAWSPLAQGGTLLADPVITRIASECERTPAQVILRWHLQLGNVAIPKSVRPARIAENAAIFDFELDEAQMQRIAGLDRADGRIGPDPRTAQF